MIFVSREVDVVNVITGDGSITLGGVFTCA